LDHCEGYKYWLSKVEQPKTAGKNRNLWNYYLRDSLVLPTSRTLNRELSFWRFGHYWHFLAVSFLELVLYFKTTSGSPLDKDRQKEKTSDSRNLVGSTTEL